VNNLIRLIKLIIDCRLFISIAAVGLASSTFKIVQEEINWIVLTSVFLSTLTAYTFPIFLKQSKFSIRWWLLFVLYATTATFSAIEFWIKGSVFLYSIYGILIFCTFFYYLPLGVIGRLRELPFLKVFLISFTWAVATVLLPLAYIIYPVFSLDILWLVLERFIFLLAITIPFDVRDIRIDAAKGLVTLPSKLGLKGALYLTFILLLVYLVISAVHFGFGNILFVRTLCVFFVLILIQKISLKKTTYYYTGLIDGSIIFQSVLIQIMV
jgi:4-hydroxybenzoate polyprenyltransferase